MNHFYALFFAIISFFSLPAQQVNSSVLNEMKGQARREQLAATQLLAARQNQQAQNTGSNYDVKYYRCEWEVDPAVRYIAGKVTTYLTPNVAANVIAFDLMRNMVVDSILYRNAKLTFIQNNDHTVTINFATALQANKLDSVTVHYKGTPIPLSSYFIEVHNGTPVVQTLSEPFGSKEWWPCKDGLTDKADSIDIIISCPVAYRSSSNGVLINEKVQGTKRVMHYKHRYPIATYLVALACTNYVTTSYNWNIQGTPIRFENWTYPEDVTWFANEVYGIENAMKWFTEKIGTYPFANERYAHTQFSWGGGMEHQTNSFMGSPSHLLQSHELGHQWFGDKTTCGSWKHIWVNEGFASYLHWFYYQKFYLPSYYDIVNGYHFEITSDSSGSVIVPDVDTLNADRIFSWRYTYVKGSYVLHILRGMLGDNAFFNCLKTYSNDPATKYGYAKTEDVKRTFEQASGKNLTEFFNDWVYGEGWPMHHINWYVNNNGYLNIKVNQRQSHPSVSFFEVPLRVQFKNATKDTTLILNLQQNGQVFAAKLNFVPDTLLIDPEKWIISGNNSQAKLEVPNSSTNIVQVYPTPANAVNWTVLIKNPTKSNYVVKIMNMVGQTVYTANLSTQGADVYTTIPNTQFAKGMYQIVVYNDKEAIVQKKLIN
jgi:aminopeptidase N